MNCTQRSLQHTTTYSPVCFAKEEVTPQTDFREINLMNDALHVPVETSTLVDVPRPKFKATLFQQTVMYSGKTVKKFQLNYVPKFRNRIDLDKNSLLAKLSILDQICAQDLRRSPGSINDIAVRFPSVIKEEQLDELEDEWQAFRQADKIDRYERTILQYWFDLGNATNMFNSLCFPRLSRLFFHLTILHHSSASVERVFLHGNCIKTKSTNRLTVESVRSRPLAKQAVIKYGNTCSKWSHRKSLSKKSLMVLAVGIIANRYRTNRPKNQSRLKFEVFKEPSPPLQHQVNHQYF